ncbi:MAG TPA: uroporphyrinogen decarboxylase family protein, partial [bacterium]|nr:uroporphyrinogen decarboxylase family protein [bacterium]
KRYFSLIHQFGVRVLFHCCGAIRPMIPDLIEAGVDILNPIQVRARGMVPAELKREFGRFLCFHGGIDIQKTLPFGTPEEVRAEVRQRLRELGKDGGYILCSTHNLQKQTPVENVLAMYEAAGSLKNR